MPVSQRHVACCLCRSCVRGTFWRAQTASRANNNAARGRGVVDRCSGRTGAVQAFGAGGGGGGTTSGGTVGTGGSGGGGNAGTSNGGAGNAGSANTGGGGGGCSTPAAGTAYAGGAGGSGIVVISYSSTYKDLSSIDAGLTYTKTTSGGNTIYKFTAGTGNISW